MLSIPLTSEGLEMDSPPGGALFGGAVEGYRVWQWLTKWGKEAAQQDCCSRERLNCVELLRAGWKILIFLSFPCPSGRGTNLPDAFFLQFYWDIIHLWYNLPFKVCNTMAFNVFTELCAYHLNLFSKFSIFPERTLVPRWAVSPWFHFLEKL